MIPRLGGLLILAWGVALAGQPPYSAKAPDLPISGGDRVYVADQFSNTLSVVDPAARALVGVLRLGDPQPENLSPLYRGQLLVHGLGFSPDRKTIVAVSIGSNSVTFIDTGTNSVKHVTYLGRSPHEAFFTQDGREVWVTVRGEDYVSVLDAHTYQERRRIRVPNGPGMVIFSPDGRYAYLCSSFTPETVVLAVAEHRIIGRVRQESPFCPNIAVTPEGDQVWMTLKDVGKVMVFQGRPPFSVIRTFEVGPITNHVNFVRNARGRFAYVSVGGLGAVQVYAVDSGALVTSVPVGELPHGLWPSGDGKEVWVALENGTEVVGIDTARNEVVARVHNGQGSQALVYVPGAVSEGGGREHLVPLGSAGETTHLTLEGAAGRSSVALFDQGLTQVLQVGASGLEPRRLYALVLAEARPGDQPPLVLARFMTNPAGAAIVDAVGPIRQLVLDPGPLPARQLFIAPLDGNTLGRPVQTQTPQGAR